MNKAFCLAMVFFLTFFAFACGDDDDDDSNPPGHEDDDDDGGDPSATLHIVDGNLQSGFVGDALIDPLVVKVQDKFDMPLADFEIRFVVLTGAGEGVAQAELFETTVLTDAEGQATCQVHLGKTPGMLRVAAESPEGYARPVTFNLSAYPPLTATQKPICILSINDFHSHVDPWGHPEDLQGGLARIVWMFKRVREMNDRIGVPTVILDGGDDFENTAFHEIPGFLSWLIATWDAAGMDVWQVGNHDFHFGIPYLNDQVQPVYEQFESGAKGHPMNVTFGSVDPRTMREDLQQYVPLFETDFADTTGQALYEQTAIIEAGDVRVGVLGVVTDAAIYTQVPGDPAFLKLVGAPNPYSEKMTFFDPDPRESDYIEKGIDSLAAEGADLIVVVSHTGLGFGDRVNLPPGKDGLIAQYGIGKTSGRAIDLIVSAHSHVQLNKPIFVDNPAGTTTPIVQAREGGLFVARIDALADVEQGGLEVLDSRLIQVNSNLAEDAQVKQEGGAWKDNETEFNQAWFEWELVRNPIWLSHRAGTTSGLGNLINDAFLWAMDQGGYEMDAAVAIPSLYRTDVWPGHVTAAEAFEVVSMHKMDDVGTNLNTLAILTFRPGTINASALLLPNSWHMGTTGLAYLLELIHSLPDLAEVIPAIGKELKIEVFQMEGVSYELDATAPMFQHVVPGSVRVNGQPVDPEKTYRVAMEQTLASTVSAAMNRLIVAFDAGGKGAVKVLMDDPETGLPFTDTGITLWEAFQDYLASLPDVSIPIEDVTVVGDVLRTEQPDLVINPAEMEAYDTVPGQTANFRINVRNIGKQSIESARVRLLVDTTPWDLTDHDVGLSVDQGLSADYLGSLSVVGERIISVDGHPDSVQCKFDWDVPENLPLGFYTLHARIDQVQGENVDPNTGAPYTDVFPDNDSGEQVMIYFTVQAPQVESP